MVRRLTRTSLSMNGMMITTPGPLPPTSPRASRPHLKITARSYSRRTLKPIRISTSAMMTTANGLNTISSLFLCREGFHMQSQTIHACDFSFVAGLQRLFADGLPEFAVNSDLPVGRQRCFDDTHEADHFFAPGDRPLPHRPHSHAHNKEGETG